MKNHISVRTTTILIAITILMMLSLMTASISPALGQSLPTVEFENINPSVDEPDQNPYRVNVVLTVRLSQASSQNVSVQYRTADITAEASERDYIAASGTVYFYPGTTERTISITVLNDTTVENSERFRVELFQPSGAMLNSSRDDANITIRDDDESAPYNLTAPATVQEDQGTFTVRVETANFPVVNINADFYIYDSPGTAQRGVDYQSVAKILYITPGETGAEFEVTLRKDTDDEPDKAFTIKMQQQSPADDQIILGVTEVTVTILDDDPATPTNLELANQTTDPDLDHVAVLQWDYSDAEGYLLESREGTSGSWRCIVAGTYSSRNPPAPVRSAQPKVAPWPPARTGTSGSAASPPRHFPTQGRPPATRKPNTAISSAQWRTRVTTSHRKTPWDRWPYPPSTPRCAPTWQPTGLTIAAGAKHRDVQISWDEPPDGSNVTGFALYRKWQGATGTDDDDLYRCLYWSTKPSEFITSYRDYAIAAYETAENKNKYTYRCTRSTTP